MFETHSPKTPFKRGTLAALACVLTFSVAGAGCIDATGRPPRAPTAGVPNFTVMTFNVHRDRWNDESTVAAVGARDADIVCLQETTSEWKQAIEQRYAAQYRYMLFAPKENAGGLAVLSHFPLVDRGVMPVPGDWHPAWHVLAQTPGGPVQILNVHLRSKFEGDASFVTNYASAQNDHVYELSLFMDGELQHVPSIIAGDFNEGPSGKAVRWLEDRGFENALPLFKPDAVTWQGGSIAKVITMKIDHVMFDDAFEPLDAWVDGHGHSDHKPVVTWLEMPPKDHAERVKVAKDDAVTGRRVE